MMMNRLLLLLAYVVVASGIKEERSRDLCSSDALKDWNDREREKEKPFTGAHNHFKLQSCTNNLLRLKIPDFANMLIYLKPL